MQFTVRDTGKGIEAERLANIFDRFNASSESSTGMGLALVRRLVVRLPWKAEWAPAPPSVSPFPWLWLNRRGI